MSSAFLASTLAAHGYPAMALAYFDEPGLPKTLTDIPLEYFVKALHLLLAQPDVDSSHVFVMGVSRGSEAALLLGADFPQLVDGVIAGVPSSMVGGNYPNTGKAAWTLGGKPLPFASIDDFAHGITSPADVPASEIPVERISGPIFTVCGEFDRTWNSCGYSKAITDRLTDHNSNNERIALEYPLAGHSITGGMAAYFSTTVALAGTVSVNAAAAADAHAKLLDLLARR